MLELSSSKSSLLLLLSLGVTLKDEGPKKLPRKRARLTLVCENCKRRKIKCDKESPCGACVKANIQDSCVFNLSFPYMSSAVRPINMDVKAQLAVHRNNGGVITESTLNANAGTRIQNEQPRDSGNKLVAESFNGNRGTDFKTISSNPQGVSMDYAASKSIPKFGKEDFPINNNTYVNGINNDSTSFTAKSGLPNNTKNLSNAFVNNYADGYNNPANGFKNYSGSSFSSGSPSDLKNLILRTSNPITTLNKESGIRGNSNGISENSLINNGKPNITSTYARGPDFGPRYNPSIAPPSMLPLPSPVLPAVSDSFLRGLPTTKPTNTSPEQIPSSNVSDNYNFQNNEKYRQPYLPLFPQSGLQAMSANFNSPLPGSYNRSNSSTTSSNLWNLHVSSITGRPESDSSMSSSVSTTKSTGVESDNIFSMLQLVGVNPIASIHDEVDLLSDKGPFAKSFLVKSEPALICLSEYIRSEAQLRTTDEEINSGVNCPGNLDIKKIATIKTDSQQIDLEEHAYISLMKQSFQRMPDCWSMSLIEKVVLVLPHRDNIWLLIERFFRYAYPWSPVVDEQEFMNKVSILIGPKSVTDHSKIKNVNYNKPLDLLAIGQLLMVLRIAYLTLFKNDELENIESLQCQDPTPSERTLQFLMKNPIHLGTVCVATQCLTEYTSASNDQDIAIIQLMFLLKMYQKFAPEVYDCADGEGRMIVDDEMLAQAYALELNVDPDSSKQYVSPNFANLKRKLWYLLLLCDVFQSYAFGLTPKIAHEPYGIKVPVTTEDNANLIDYERDGAITSMFFEHSEVLESLRKLTCAILPKSGKSKIAEVVTHLNYYEKLCLLKSCRFNSFFEPPYTDECFSKMKDSDSALLIVKRNFSIKYHFLMKSTLATIYFNLYLYYSTAGETNISFFYFKKSMMCLTELAPKLYKLLNVRATFSDFIYNPIVQSHVYNSNLILQAIIIRFSFVLQHNKYNNNLREDEQEYFAIMTQIRDNMISCVERELQLISKLSHRYFFSWRITKGTKFSLKVIKSDEFYNKVLSNRDNKYKKDLTQPRFSKEQLLELLAICQSCDQNVKLERETKAGESEDDVPDWDMKQNNCPTAESDNSPQTNTDIDVDQLWLDVFQKDPAKEVTLFDLFNDFKFEGTLS